MPNWTLEQLRARNLAMGFPAPSAGEAAPKRAKYRNRAKEVDGILFQSSKEARRYLELKAMQTAGLISELKTQPRFPIMESFTYEGKALRKAEYVADFSYLRAGELWVEDVKCKATRTQLYMLKRKLFLRAYPKLKFQEIL